jgi:IS5 family transposase
MRGSASSPCSVRLSSDACWRWRDGCLTRTSASVDRRSTRCTHRKWNASARASQTGPTSSVSRSRSHAKDGQFVIHVKALPGNPYDGHTLVTVIPDMEARAGNIIERIFIDKGYRGRNGPPDHKFRVFISGQKRRITPQIRRQLRQRSAVEPVIGHPKSEHRMGRNYL